MLCGDTLMDMNFCGVRRSKKYMLVTSVLCLALTVQVETHLYLAATWTCQWLVVHWWFW